MRLLCDQHVASKYLHAFEQEFWISVETVREVLSADATDAAIATFAAEDDWVVFTNDDDFFQPRVPHGLLVYSQIEDPSPDDVVEAVNTISAAYGDHTEIVEVVPDGWV